MTDKLTQVAAAAANDKMLVDKLDQILAGPNDRAFVVCTLNSCEMNLKGRCTIFTVLDVPRMRTGGQVCQRV
ncbi:MAG TPA: hypothetical protein VJ550_17120 [Geomonas sp.]|nr:hypothetical protein [Geomonas sp.]